MEDKRYRRAVGNEESSIDEAWRNFGLVIVNDACEEWLECAKGLKKLEIKSRHRGLTSIDEARAATLKANMKLTERWLRGDLCYSLCGIEGQVIMENLEKQVRKW